jgi:NitT/TauT family transport system substrate-binding protein
MMISGRRSVAVLLALVLAGAGAACSASGDDGGGRKTATTRLEVGVVPVIDVAPLYLGLSKGFFAAQHLDVTPRPSQAGATIVAGVVSGSQKIGFSNNTSLLIAASKNVPLRIVAAGNQAAAGDYAAIFSRSDSAITTARDLAGKRIAVNSLSNVGSLTVNAAMQASGADISGVKFVELPFPQMGAALAQRRVDAVWAVEPFVSAIRATGGARIVLRTYPLVAAHFPVASYFTSRAYASANADVVDRFRRAMNQSLAYAAGHPDEIRKILPSYIDLPPAVAAKVTLPEWSTDVGLPLLRKTAELARRYGYLKTEPDVNRLVNG